MTQHYWTKSKPSQRLLGEQQLAARRSGRNLKSCAERPEHRMLDEDSTSVDNKQPTYAQNVTPDRNSTSAVSRLEPPTNSSGTHSSTAA